MTTLVPEDLKVNQLVEVIVLSHQEQGSYRTRVEGIIRDGIHIGIPIVNGYLLPVYPGDEVQVSYQVKKEYNQLLTYSFTSRIRGRERSPVPVMVIDLPDKVHKAQRRNFLRIPVNLLCHWSLPEEEADHPATIVDLSGGGCLLKTNYPVEEDLIIKLKFTLPERPELLLNSKVIRIVAHEDKTPVNYYYGVEFIQIRENHRDMIVKYLFDIQRKNITKRRI